MRSIRNTARIAAAGAALLATATITAATAQAAAEGAAGRTTGVDRGATAAGDAGSTSSRARLTAEAKQAGEARFGEDATYRQSLKAFWTAERMAAAVPVEESPAFVKQVREYVAEQRDAIEAGEKPVTHDGKVRTVEGATSTRIDAAAPAAYNPNLPYYTPTAYTNGKVFYLKGGTPYVCSGSIINTEGKDAVWTAGHCVHGGSGQGWHTNWMFVPAYDDDLANPRPYGTWTARFLSSRTAWTNSSDFSQDIGVATMNTNFGGWHIADYFGGQGFTVNRGKNVYEYAFGYPAESPFDGGNLMRCQGTTSPEWDAWIVWSQTVKIPCDMTRGSSGGPWLYGYNGDWGYLNGVNSRIDRIVGPTIMLSPYFDNDAWDLYNFTRHN